MKKLLLICVFGSVIGLSGCATTPMQGVNRVLYEETVAGTDRGIFIIEKDNDLYLRNQVPVFPLRISYTDRRLTNTPNVVKTDLRVWPESGCITYFANDGNGGHWYMQPVSGDDSNKKEISPADIMKMGK